MLFLQKVIQYIVTRSLITYARLNSNANSVDTLHNLAHPGVKLKRFANVSFGPAWTLQPVSTRLHSLSKGKGNKTQPKARYKLFGSRWAFLTYQYRPYWAVTNILRLPILPDMHRPLHNYENDYTILLQILSISFSWTWTHKSLF